MKVSAEFVHLVRRMHQDIDIDHSGDDELVASMVRGLSSEQRTIVKQFLDDLLAQDLSADELNEIWNQTEPDWGFTNDGARVFLGMVRDALSERS